MNEKRDGRPKPEFDRTEVEINWRQQANCRKHPEVDFFPELNPRIPEQEHRDKYKERLVKIAKAVCAECEVKKECLEFAVSTNQPYGIWGGVEQKELKMYRRRWLADKRRNAKEST